MEFSSVETIKQCAALGMGIACLPGLVVEQEIAAKKLAVFPWNGSSLTMKTIVAWHKDKWISPAMNAFLSLLREQLTPAHTSDRTHKGIASSVAVKTRT
jgi:DNA-binding transcriptional LysR family regulator